MIRQTNTRDAMLNLAIGAVIGHDGVNKHGVNTSVAAGTAEDIWDGGGTHSLPSNTHATGTITAATAVANAYATGTAQCISVVDLDTVTINGLDYTAVSGTKLDNTEFSIDTSNDACAADLEDSINNDVRTGTLNYVSASAVTNTITLTSSELGTAGDATTLAQTGGNIVLSGAVFTGGVDANTTTVNGLLYTAVAGAAADFTQFSIDTGNNETATSLAAAIDGDVRVGTLGDCSAVSASAVVTITTDIEGIGGNAVTLVSSGATLAVSAATLTGGSFEHITKVSQTVNQVAMLGANIEVTGLDVDWNLVTQVIALDGTATTTAVTLVTPLIRVTEMRVLANVVIDSPIRAHNDAESVDYAVISIGNNKTVMALYTVPNGYSAYIIQYDGNVVESTGLEPTSTNFKLWTADRENDYEFQLEHSKAIPKAGVAMDHQFKPYLKVTQKSDIKISALCDTQPGYVQAGFSLVIVKD